MGNNIPFLCGGTFFTLLLQAKKDPGKRKKFGDMSNFTEADILDALFKVVYPEFQKPTDSDSFASAVSSYKSCKSTAKGRLLPTDLVISTAFDNRVKTDYVSTLKAVNEIINKYIEINTSANKDKWLASALIEFISIDDLISPTQKFYIMLDGSYKTKSEIYNLTEVCLSALVLGVWHFIVVNRKDNTVGESTYQSWHKKPDTPNSRWGFVSQIGLGNMNTIKLIPFSEKAETTDYNGECDTEQGEPYIKEETEKLPPIVYAQNVTQNGDHNINIGFQFNVH